MNDPFQKKRPDDNGESLADDLLGIDGGVTPAPLDDDPLDLDGLDVEPEPVAPVAESIAEPEPETRAWESDSVESVADGGDDDFGFGLLESDPKPAKAPSRPT